MTTPPILTYVEDASRVLYTLYETWRKHHGECHHFGHEDWYNPGLPRCVRESQATDYDRLLAVGRVQLSAKKPGQFHAWVLIIPGVDLALLCPNGAAFFRQWQMAAMRMPINALHRERITEGSDPENGELE